MFKKKPNVKAVAPIRSSDRRKLADGIIRDYGLSIAPAADATEEQRTAATAHHTQLRNSLLPDGTQAARFATTHGPELRPVSGTLYVGSYSPSAEVRVLWFSLEGRLYPTVYSLWQNPGLVPLLHTPEAVVDKIKGGADLMTPGLAGPPFPAKAVADAVVAVASLDHPSVPAAMGTCAFDIAALTTKTGAKGRAVEPMHWVGDELWSYSPNGKAGIPAPAELEGWLPKVDEVEQVTSGAADLSLEDGGVALNENSKEISTNAADGSEEIVIEQPVDDVQDQEGPPLTTKQIDEAFRRAFLYGIHQHLTSHNPPNHGLDFPLNQSFVMSTLIQPFLPIFTAQDSKQLQIKNTSFKGLKKFIKSLDKEQIIKAKEKPSEILIMDVDFKDAAVTEFKPYRLPKKDAAQSRDSAPSHPASDDDPSIGQILALKTVYKVPEKLSALFEDPPADHFLSAAAIKSAVSAYIDTHALTNPKNKRLAALDTFFTDTLFTGASGIDAQIRAQGSCTRDAIADRALAACTAHWTLSRKPANGGDKTTTKPKPSAPPRVKVTLELRSNKKVTKISGLERFHVPPIQLAEELRRACAGSTSVEPLVGASPKDGLSEVMVQGPQREAVLKALARRGVEERWVEVLDKMKKK